jgi:hypothetical protein
MVSCNRCDKNLLTRSEVLAVADVKISVFWEVISCSVTEK